MKFLFIIISIFIVSLSVYFFIFRQPPSTTVTDQSLPTFTSATIKNYDGTDPALPIYIALDGAVYDVSNGREFYEPKGPYHYLAGKDSSVPLNLIGGDIIRKKYPIIGRFVPN